MKKLGKLKIHEMQSYPEITSAEQMEMKGGGGWETLLGWVASLFGGSEDNSTHTASQTHSGSGSNIAGNQYNFTGISIVSSTGQSVSPDSIRNGSYTITGQDSIKYNGKEYMIYGDSVVIKPMN